MARPCRTLSPGAWGGSCEPGASPPQHASSPPASPMCGSLRAGCGRCLAPALWTGMLGATQATVTCSRQAVAWEESREIKAAPALSAWSNAAQKCFFSVLHTLLVPLMLQARGVRGGKEVSLAWGQPPKQLPALGDAGTGTGDTPVPACPRAARLHFSRARGISSCLCCSPSTEYFAGPQTEDTELVQQPLVGVLLPGHL